MNHSQTTKSRIASLDGLRAVAIIMVMLSHSARAFGEQITIRIGSVDLHNIIYNGGMGVDLFFVLSGFLITSQLLNKSLTKKNLYTYSMRRFFRIAPTYYIAVIATLFIFLLPFDIKDITAAEFAEKWWLPLLAHIIFLHDYIGRSPSINGLFWSIPVEIKFYLVLPAILFLVGKIKSPEHQIYSISLFFVFFVFIRGAFIYLQYGLETITYEKYFYDIKTPFHMSLDGLIVGVICAFLLGNDKIKSLKNHTPAMDAFFIAGLLGFFSTAIWPHLTGDVATFYECSLMTTMYAVSFGLVLFALVHGCSITRFFENNILKFIAKISYCLYLGHLFTISIQSMITDIIRPYFTSPTLCWFVSFLFFAACSLILAYALHRIVEKPFLDWSKKRFKYE